MTAGRGMVADSGWRRLAWRALCSGSLASLVSSFTLAVACRLRGRPAASGSNATSHWIWGARAWRKLDGDLQHTVPGYLIHHASSVFWAVWFERWLQRDPPSDRAQVAGRALAVSAVAGAVDYLAVPRRLTPGFEAHLKPVMIPGVYLAFAAGLAICGARRAGRGGKPR